MPRYKCTVLEVVQVRRPVVYFLEAASEEEARDRLELGETLAECRTVQSIEQVPEADKGMDDAT